MRLIPVHRPKLPDYTKITPYLKEMDEARWYSNFGPLITKFEERLANHFHIESKMITTASNGTLMLTAMLKAMNAAPGSLCIMPSWTFIATAAAAHYAGLIPYFVDVDRETQAINPTFLKEKIKNIKQAIGAVIVIAPFGAPINREEWDNFTQETHIPVIIDAAAAFDTVGRLSSMEIGSTPFMVSLHATKVFGIGEGGIALTHDQELIKRIRGYISFGFNMNREALIPGFNAKASEYMAAVGLASLDEWADTRLRWENVTHQYIEQLDKRSIDHSLSPNWVSSTCNVILPLQADEMAELLRSEGIDTRKWWLNGCHLHQAYQHLPRDIDLSNTEWLSKSILGLPLAVDLDNLSITYICNTLEKLLSTQKKTNQKLALIK